jgi:hypothetical protein
MPRGRGVAWLEELIAKGEPGSILTLASEIKDLISRSRRSDTARALSGILASVEGGWTLTDHKRSELERLRNQVNDDLADLELNDRQRNLVVGLEARKQHTYLYWAARPVISQRLSMVFGRWSGEGKISPDDWEFMRENFKGPVAEFEDGKHPVGSLRWTRTRVPVTVMGEPSFDGHGNLSIEVLAPNGVLKLDVRGVLKRPPK